MPNILSKGLTDHDHPFQIQERSPPWDQGIFGSLDQREGEKGASGEGEAKGLGKVKSLSSDMDC